MARSIFLPIIALCLVAGCAITSPPLPADNPASAQAPEARVKPLRALERDAITQRTRQMLVQAARQQEEWEKKGPDSGDQQGQQMQKMPGMQMPRQQSSPTPTPEQRQIDQMPGMKMPQEQSQPSPTPTN